MIALSAEIYVGSLNKVLYSDFDHGSNNISNEIEYVFYQKGDFQYPFLLGVSKLGDNSKLQSESTAYISEQCSDSNGIFPTEFVLELTPELQAPIYLTIKFDTDNNGHPNSIKIGKSTYKVDDPIFTTRVEFYEPFQVVISDWNRPNEPLVISSIETLDYLVLDKKTLLSLETTTADRADFTKPNYGIISNKASLTFRDIDGEVLDMIRGRLLKKGQQTDIYVYNTLYGKRRQNLVAQMFVDSIEYSEENENVSISLTDGLTEWQDVNVSAISYDPRKQEHKNLFWYYEQLVKLNPNRNKFSFYLTDNIKQILESIIIPYPLLNEGSYWAQWTKVCQVGGMYLYKNGSTIELNYTNGS